MTDIVNSTEHKNTNTEKTSIPHKKKKFFNKHKTKNKQIKNTEEQLDLTEEYQDNIEPSKYNIEDFKIFNMIQCKTGFNKEEFWNILNQNLTTTPFNKILRNDMNLIAYAILYENTYIFNELIDNYGSFMTAEDIQDSILKLSFNKNPGILLKVYNYTKDNNINFNTDFTNKFISYVAKNSYREENNNIFINWLTPLLNEENKKEFWNDCFNSKNIPLMLCALKHENQTLKNYLKSNINIYENEIKDSGREHAIYKEFNAQYKKINDNTQEELESTSILPKQPNIVIKKKKFI